MTHTDSCWQPLPACADARLRHWLRDRGSLTRRIQARCDDFHLQLLSQRSAPAGPDEARAIGLKPGMKCIEREVTLNCGNRAVVFAHSVLSPQSLKGPWRMLGGLGAKPLGAALFADPCIRRFPLRFRQLSVHHRLYPRAAHCLRRPPPVLCARRSLFVLHDAPLLVTEVFLPAILELAP